MRFGARCVGGSLSAISGPPLCVCAPPPLVSSQWAFPESAGPLRWSEVLPLALGCLWSSAGPPPRPSWSADGSSPSPSRPSVRSGLHPSTCGHGCRFELAVTKAEDKIRPFSLCTAPILAAVFPSLAPHLRRSSQKKSTPTWRGNPSPQALLSLSLCLYSLLVCVPRASNHHTGR